MGTLIEWYPNTHSRIGIQLLYMNKDKDSAWEAFKQEHRNAERSECKMYTIENVPNAIYASYMNANCIR